MTADASSPKERLSAGAVLVSSVSRAIRVLTFTAMSIGVFTSARAQFDAAAVLGTIKDPSGAAVPSATVQLRDIGKGVTVTRQTDANGNYEIDNVQPGEFTVTVTAAGFDKSMTSPFKVNIGARQRVELTLKLGSNAESVTVSGAASLLETDSSDRGQTIQSREIVNLPLNGRSYADLATLVPGVRKSLLEVLSNPSRDASYNVNGLNSMTNNFQLDGIDNNAYQTANQGFSNEAIVPSPDAVQEFKVQTDNYSAEYGRAGGAIINATIRSGTNAFHGVVYEYFRNTILNAYGPFLGNGVKPSLIQNQFGATLGGPIKRDKLFFFADFDGLRNINRNILTAIVPTVAQSQGIFTDASGNPIPLVNPVTGAVYADGRIPASDQSPFAVKVLSLLQHDAPPNTVVSPGGNNYVSTPANTINVNQGDIRADAFLNPRSSVFGRYSQRSWQVLMAPNIPGLAGGNTVGTLYDYTRQVTAGYNFAPTPRSILELRLGLTWTTSGKNPLNIGSDNLLADFNIPNVPTDATLTGGLDSQTVTGFSAFGRQTSNPQFTNPFLANPKVNYGFQKGRNSIKVGAEYGYLNQAISDFHPQFGASFYASQFSRGKVASSSDPARRQAYNLADFLLGARNSYQLNNLATVEMQRRMYMGYAQDDVRINDKFTANIGIRYEFVTPYYEQNKRLANFDPISNALVQAADGSLYNRSLVNPDRKDFAPRIGFAYQLDGKTVVRGGYGIGYMHFFRVGGESLLSYNGPYIVNGTVNQTPPSVAGGQALCTSLTQNPATCFRTTQMGYQTNFASAQNFSTLTAQTRYIPRDNPTGYVQAYHVTVQHELQKNTTLEISYVGSHGVHIPILTDLNQGSPEPATCNTATGAGCLSQQQRRPNQKFTNILATLPTGFLNYDSLQTKLEKRYSNGIFLLNSFTWSRAFNNTSADLETNGGDSPLVNFYKPAGDRGPSGYDQPLNDTLTVLADVPFGRGRRFGNSASAWQQATLGGWQLSAINVVTSGLPINLTYAPAGAYVVSSTSVGYSVRPNLVSTPAAVYAPKSQRVKTNSGLSGTLLASQVQIPSVSQFFGNAGRNALRGPAFAQLDLGLHKALPLWSESSNLEFRMEAFNAFNATNYQTPDSARTDGAFGTYTAANAYPARQVQLALRLSF